MRRQEQRNQITEVDAKEVGIKREKKLVNNVRKKRKQEKELWRSKAGVEKKKRSYKRGEKKNLEKRK